MTNDKILDASCDSTGGICQLNMAYTANANATAWFSIGSKSATNVIYNVENGSVSLVAQNKYVNAIHASR